MRITIAEAKYGIDLMPLNLDTTDEFESLDAAVAHIEQRLSDRGDKWTRVHMPDIVTFDVDDPPDDTILWIIDTDACEKRFHMPIKEAISRILASHGGAVLEPGPARTLKVRPLKVTPGHIAAIMGTQPLVALTNAAYNDIVEALGGPDQAVKFLAEQATEHNKPIAVNLPDHSGSQTIFISPEGWAEGRLKGWVGTNKAALEAQFGEVTGPPSAGPISKTRRKKRKK